MSTISLNGHAVLELLEFIAPDHETDKDQLDTEFCLVEKPEPWVASDGSTQKPGVYAYLLEYPEEGVFGPLGEPNIES